VGSGIRGPQGGRCQGPRTGKDGSDSVAHFSYVSELGQITVCSFAGCIFPAFVSAAIRGLKKGSSYSHAIYSVRKVVEHYTNGGSTVNVCLLDLSKAFDKMNNFALYIKLMNRSIPVQVLSVLENWFSSCLSCVKWGSVMSYFYVLKTDVRQGSVLSPILFSVFIGDLVKLVNKANIGCRIGASSAAIFLYADDIILL